MTDHEQRTYMIISLNSAAISMVLALYNKNWKQPTVTKRTKYFASSFLMLSN